MKVDLPPLRRDPSEILSDGLDRRLVVLVLGGILCLGMALGLELFPHFAGRDLRTVRLSPIAGRSVAPLLEPVAIPELPSPPAKDLTYGQLKQILSSRRGDPAADRFVREFFGSAELKRTYEEYEKGSPDRPATEFVGLLQRSAEFGDLMRSHSRQPEFRALAEGLTKHPDLNRLLRALRSPAAPQGSFVPKFAPSDRGADTLEAEFKGRASPVGTIKAPGRPVPPDQ